MLFPCGNPVPPVSCRPYSVSARGWDVSTERVSSDIATNRKVDRWRQTLMDGSFHTMISPSLSVKFSGGTFLKGMQSMV